jgi:hypothetical protein
MTRDKHKSISTGPRYFPIIFALTKIVVRCFESIKNQTFTKTAFKWGICIFYYEMIPFNLYVDCAHLYILTRFNTVKMDNFLSPHKVMQHWGKWKSCKNDQDEGRQLWKFAMEKDEWWKYKKYMAVNKVMREVNEVQ